MREVRVSESLIGNRITTPIFSEQGNLLLKEGVLIDKNVLFKLEMHDIEFISVLDELIDDIKPVSIIDETKYEKAVSDIKSVFETLMEQEHIGIKDSIPPEHLELVKKIINELMIALENAEDILYAINDLLHTDEYTYIHSVHVTILSIITSKALNYEYDDIKHIALGALLHDIGKVRVDVNLILSPGKLNKQERKNVERHSQLGYELLEELDDLSFTTKQIIRLHHEKIDGSGYPLGLKGIEIPEYVRIVTVCDMYDAMTTDRVYRKKMPAYKALDILMAEAIYKIDAKIYSVLMKNIAIYPIGAGVILSDGSIGMVTGYRNVNPVRPKVRILKSKIGSKHLVLDEINLEENQILFIEDVWDLEEVRTKKRDGKIIKN